MLYTPPLMKSYLDEIGRIDLLTPDEELALARRVKDGDDEALIQLTQANLRFVVAVARKYQGRGLSLDDLVSEGNYGLINAAMRFDETRGFRFISYAVWWIRQAILQALAAHARTVRLPTNRLAVLSKMRKAHDRLTQELGRAPRPDEIAQALDADPEMVRWYEEIARQSLSLDAPVGGDNSSALLDLLAEDEAPLPDAPYADEAIKHEVESLLGRLRPREAETLRMYFGIGRTKGLTLDEIGERLGVSRERARQIKEKALRRLRMRHLQSKRYHC